MSDLVTGRHGGIADCSWIQGDPEGLTPIGVHASEPGRPEGSGGTQPVPPTWEEERLGLGSFTARRIRVEYSVGSWPLGIEG